MNIGDLYVTLRGDLAQLRSQIQRDLTGIAGTAGAGAGQTFGDRMQQQVQRGTVLAGAAVGSFVAGSVQAFGQFDDQMRAVYSILPGISEETMREMEGDVKSLAKEMGRLPSDIIPGLYDALSSGIPQENVFAFMEAASKGAVAGGADTQEVVRVLAATVNAFRLDASKTTEITDSFFNAINRGVTTFPELAQSLAGVTPQAAALGLSIDDVLAAITAITLQGTPTASAVTQINASLTALQRQTPPMAAALKALGFETGQAALEALGYQGLMEALAQQADAMGVPLIKLTGRIDGANAIMQLTGQNTEKARELLGTFGDTAGLTTAAFEQMQGGIGGAARKLAADVRVAMIDVGERLQALGPIFIAFGPTMGRLLGAGLGAAAGLVVNGVATLFRGLLPALLGQATVAGTASGTAQGQAHAAAVAGPGIGTRIVMALLGHMKTLALAVVGPGTLIGGIIGRSIAAGQRGAGFLAMIMAPILQALAAAAIAVAGPGTLIGAAISGAIALGMAAFPFVIGALLIGALIAIIRDPELVSKAIDMGVGIVKGIGEGIIMLAGWIGEALIGVVRSAWNAVLNFIGNAISGLIEPFRSLVSMINDATGGALQGLVDDLDRFQGELEGWGREAEQTFSETAEHTGKSADDMAFALASTGDAAIVAADVTSGAMGEITDATGMMAEEVGADAEAAADKLLEEMLQSARDAAWAGAKTPREYAAGLRSEFAEPRDAMKALKDLMRETLSPAEKEAQLIGIATSKRLARALADGRPEVRSEAQQIALDTIRELAKTNPKSAEIGRLVTKLFANATKDELPLLRNAISVITGIPENQLNQLPGIAYDAGAKIAGRLAAGIGSQRRAVANATSDLANVVKRGLLLESPAQEGPWSIRGGPIAWMERAADRMWSGFIDHTLAARPALVAALASTAGAVGDIAGRTVADFTAGVRLDMGLPSFSTSALAGAVPAGTLRYEHDVALHVDPESADALRRAGYEPRDIARELSEIVETAYANRSLRWSAG